MALDITDANFDESLKNNSFLIIDFWAPWCGPCRQLGPIVDELAVDNTIVTIGKINVDENPAVAAKYGIRGIPAIIFFKDGLEVGKNVGLASKAALQKKIDEIYS